jgi:hypothetical protein
MKFFFCETCGKRITDADLDQGAAKDKKLKGVYCRECAVGISTIEFQALNVEKPQVGAPVQKRSVQRTTGTDRGERTPAVSSVPRDGASTTRKPGNRVIAVASAIAGLLLAVLAVVWLTNHQSKSSEQKSTDSNRAPKTSREEDKSAPERTVPVAPVSPKDAPAVPNVPIPQEPAHAAVEDSSASTSGVAVEATKPSLPETNPIVPPQSKSPASMHARSDGDFDLKTAESFSSFQKYFALIHPLNAEMKYEAGRIVIRRTNFDNQPTWEKSGGIYLQAEAIKPGVNWDLLFKINFNIGQKDFKDVTEHTLRAGLVELCFIKPGDTPGNYLNSSYFGLKLATVYGGSLMCGWAKPGGHIDTDRKNDIFDGIRLVSGSGKVGPLWKDDKLKTPASSDGIYSIKLSMRKESFTVSVNSTSFAGYQLTPDSITRISSSPLTVFINAAGNLREIELQEFSFSAVEVHLDSNEPTGKPEAPQKPVTPVPSTVESTPDTAEAKPKSEALMPGVDPRIQAAFQGKVLSYDARTQEISVAYDFSNREQFNDFEKPHEEYGSAEWVDGGIRVKGHSGYDQPLVSNRFSTKHLTVEFSYKDLRHTNMYVMFFPPNSPAAEQGLYFEATKGKAWFRRRGRFPTLGGTLLKELPMDSLPASAKIEAKCEGKHYAIKINEKELISYDDNQENAYSGLSFGASFETEYTITNIKFSGHLDSQWLDKIAPRK